MSHPFVEQLADYSSVRSLRYRNAPTFEYPVALVAWLDHVKSASPDWDTIGKVLVQAAEIDKENIENLRSTSDTIVFDFLIDGRFTFIRNRNSDYFKDHDKHNVQNWKEWRYANATYPLVWDSGLGWMHGPDGNDPTCTNLLCGPKEWREIEPGWTDAICRPICRFNSATIHKLRDMSSSLTL